MNFDMIANAKMDTTSAIELLMSIIHDEVISEVGPSDNDDIENTLNAFIGAYIKLKKHIMVYRDKIENEQILEKLMDDLINKIDGDSYMKPLMKKKIIKLKETLDGKGSTKNIYKVKLC